MKHLRKIYLSFLIVVSLFLLSACSKNNPNTDVILSPQSSSTENIDTSTENLNSNNQDNLNNSNTIHNNNILDLAVLPIYWEAMDPSSLENYNDVLIEALDFVDRANTSNSNYKTDYESMYQQLLESYNNLVFQQGDIPRVYVNTTSPSCGILNYAKNKQVIVSSCETKDLPGYYAIDGNGLTRWSSQYQDNEYLIVSLGADYEIGYLSIQWEAAPNAYEILISQDGETWSNLLTIKEKKESFQEFTFTPVKASYVKIQGVSRSTEYGYSIFDLVVSKRKNPEIVQKALNKLETEASVISEEYNNATIVIVDSIGGSSDTVIDAYSKIKIRGNTTSRAPKKPYNIKLSEDYSVLGMDSGSKWCLLANAYDKSLMRNKISMDFAEIANPNCSLQTIYVDVYVNGVFMGNYLMTEPASDGKNRVDIDIDKREFMIERTYDTNTNESIYISPLYGIKYTYEYPEYEELTSDIKTFIDSCFLIAEEAISSGDQETIETVIDIESFVNQYILNELFKSVDFSFDSTKYYYKNGKFYAGPLWDMDLSMGNTNNSYDYYIYDEYNNINTYGDGSSDSSSGIWAQKDWYGALMKYEFFKEKVANRYKELSSEIESIYAINGKIDNILDDYLPSFSRNYEAAGWSLSEPDSEMEYQQPSKDFLENVETLRQWIKERDMYLRLYFGI